MNHRAFVISKLALILNLFGMPVFAQTCPPGNPLVAPDIRYVVHANGTVTDRETGLMWKRCGEGHSGQDCEGSIVWFYWKDAMQAAASSNFAGYSDWRLPNVKELQGLVETGCHFPSINAVVFPNTESTVYWTSTPLAFGAEVWRVGFNIGATTIGFRRDIGRVRLVRNRQ